MQRIIVRPEPAFITIGQNVTCCRGWNAAKKEQTLRQVYPMLKFAELIHDMKVAISEGKTDHRLYNLFINTVHEFQIPSSGDGRKVLLELCCEFIPGLENILKNGRAKQRWYNLLPCAR